MRHTRFMTDGQSVCSNPKRLELFDSPVVIDTNPNDPHSCNLCPKFIREHNQREYEKELNERIKRTTNGDREPIDWNLFWSTFAISSGFWITVSILFNVVFL
jgi:hypothetical protein